MKRPSFPKMFRNLLRKRLAGEITPQEYAERRARLVKCKIMFLESKAERKSA